MNDVRIPSQRTPTPAAPAPVREAQPSAQAAEQAQAPAQEPSSVAQGLMQDRFEPAGGSSPVAIDPAQATTDAAGSTSSSEPIREDRVEMAVNMTINGRDVVNFLNSEGLTQEEKDAYIAGLAKDPDKQMYLYSEMDQLSASEHQQVAEGIDSAFRNGQLTSDDLLNLADFDGSGMGPQRLVNLLNMDPGQRTQGSAMEALGEELAQRNGNDNDRLAAALVFTSSPELAREHLDTPEKRADAFNRLTGALTSDALDPLPDELQDAFRTQLINQTGQLFVDHGAELVDSLTEPGNPNGPGTLSTFFSEVMFSEEVGNVSAESGQPLGEAIQDTVGNIAEGYLDDIQNSQNPVEREQAALRIGRLVGGISGGAEMRIARYNDELKESQEAREALTGPLNALLGKVGGAVAGAAGGGGAGAFAADKLASWVSDAVGRALIQDPDKPDVGLANDIFYAMQKEISDFAGRTGIAGVSSDFETGWNTWRELIEDHIEGVS